MPRKLESSFISSSSLDQGTAARITIGVSGPTNDAPFTGYIDDLRISRFARYTSNFTPPTAAFKDR